MAEYSGFFPDVNGDREYTAEFLAKWIASFISNGVYNGSLSVAAGNHMQIVLPSGQAWINGYYYRNDGNLVLPIANADGVLNRKDTVVLRWDINARKITAQVLTGTFASNPIAPAITRNVEQYDLKIAEISIPAGTTAITQSLVTDTRLDNNMCGIVHAVVDHIDTTTFYKQIQNDLAHFKSDSESGFLTWSDAQKIAFETWLQSIKDALDGDTAGNLLNLINGIGEEVNKKIESATLGGVPVPKDGNTLQFPAPTAWTATAVAWDSANACFNLTIPDFIFSEGCIVTFKATNAPQDNNGWSCISINNNDGYRLALRSVSDKAALPSDAWTTDSMVTLTLSSTIIDVASSGDGRYGTAFFKGGAGSIKEMFDFPLSMQIAAPTPISINHIWIQNDRKMSFAVDEAIRASDWDGSDMYYGIVDNTDNNSMYHQAPKMTTDGTDIYCINRHINKDSCPWRISSGTGIAKRHGISVYSDNYSKWPRIYSRINGVVDMENAMRWDGSAWQWLSQKGHYVFISGRSSVVFNRTEASLVRHSDFLSELPSSYSDDTSKIETTVDGNYVLHTLYDAVEIFMRNGDSFARVNHNINNNLSDYNPIHQISFSPDSTYLALAYLKGDVKICKRQADNTWAYLRTFTGSSENGVCWNDASTRLFIYANGAINVYARLGDSFSLLKTISAGRTEKMFFKYNKLVTTYSNQMYIMDYYVNDTYSGFRSPSGNRFKNTKVVILSNNRIIAINNFNVCLIDATATSILSSVELINPRSVAISPDEKYAFVCANNANVVNVLSIGANSLTLIETIPCGVSTTDIAVW